MGSLIEVGGILGLVVFVFSLYRLFIANNAMDVGVSLLRVNIALLGIAAVSFSESIVLVSLVLLFAIGSILVLTVIRSEVQIKND
jgi:hypothetical protein